MRGAALVALAISWSPLSIAAAQVCSGDLPYAGAPLHLAFAMAFTSNAESYHGGFGLGNAHVYGTAEIGLTTYNAYEGGKAWDYGASFGLQLSAPASRLQFCPQVFAGFSNGPDDIGGTGQDFSAQHVSIGTSLGYVAVHDNGIAIVPRASLILANSHAKLTSPTAADRSDWDTFGFFIVGVGIRFNEQVSLGGLVSFPFALEGAETSFGVSFSITLIGGPH